MNFDDMQKLWQQQENNTVFSINDFVLREVLTRKRQEVSRQFRFDELTNYVAGAVFILAVPFIFLIMWFDDDPRTVGDFISVVMAGVAIFYWLAWNMLQRKRRRLAERLYTASIKDEIARSIAELDFEIALRTDVSKLLTAYLPLPVTSVLLFWALFRINNEPVNFMVYSTVLILLFKIYADLKAKRKQVATYFFPRRQELKQLRVKLTE